MHLTTPFSSSRSAFDLLDRKLFVFVSFELPLLKKIRSLCMFSADCGMLPMILQKKKKKKKKENARGVTLGATLWRQCPPYEVEQNQMKRNTPNEVVARIASAQGGSWVLSSPALQMQI
jgi:hypothetical protein